MFSSVFPSSGADHIPSDGFLGTGFFEAGGFTPWDTQQTPFVFPIPDQEPVFSFSGSDNSNSNSNSTPKMNSPNSGSEEGEPNPTVVNPIDERKRRRMISNRESARRSRMRKQKHLENLRNQANRIKTQNRDLMNRLRFVNHYGQLLREENDGLRSESMMLQQKLWDIRQVLLVWQLRHQLLSSSSAWPCNNNVTSINEQNPPSLIT